MTKNTIGHAIEKAKKWFGRDDLITEPEEIQWTPPEAMVHIGSLVALEYESDKFDGKSRIYRHDSEQNHDLYLSPDGKTIVVNPGFTVTERGIEG